MSTGRHLETFRSEKREEEEEEEEEEIFRNIEIVLHEMDRSTWDTDLDGLLEGRSCSCRML